MKNKAVIIIAIIVAIAVVIGAVLIYLNKDGKEKEVEDKKAETTSTNTTNTTSTTTNTINNNDNNTTKNNTTTDKKEEKKNTYEEAAEKQMAEPEEGETIAVIHVKNYGDITVKFFDDIAPKAVENFLTHSKEGYYDNVIFHRVINEFMIQGGDPQGNGYGGESIWGKGFGEELDESIVPYRGSLCMASSGVGTSSLGSQFFITQAHYDEDTANYYKRNDLPTDLLKMYKKYGGALHLYGSYTVFGQVIDGMDIVDKIATVKTNGKDKPLEDVVIESIEVKEYKK